MEKLKVYLKDGTDISEKCRMNGDVLLVPYDESIEKPNDYYSGLTVNDIVYEKVETIKVFLEKDTNYYSVIKQ